MLKKIYFVKYDERRADNNSEDHGTDCQVIPESAVIVSSHILFIVWHMYEIRVDVDSRIREFSDQHFDQPVLLVLVMVICFNFDHVH